MTGHRECLILCTNTVNRMPQESTLGLVLVNVFISRSEEFAVNHVEQFAADVRMREDQLTCSVTCLASRDLDRVEDQQEIVFLTLVF